MVAPTWLHASRAAARKPSSIYVLIRDRRMSWWPLCRGGRRASNQASSPEKPAKSARSNAGPRLEQYGRVANGLAERSRPYRQMTGPKRFRSTAGSHRRSIGSWAPARGIPIGGARPRFPPRTCTWCPIDTMSSLSAAICRRATLPNPRSIGSFLMRLGEAAAKRERRQNRSVALVRVEVWKIEFSGPGGACRSRFPLAV